MSMAALLLAVEAKVKSITGLTTANVGVQEDGQPPPFSGEEYFAIHPAGFANDAETRFDETYAVDVTISRRSTKYPQDRVGAELIAKATTGLYARAEAVRAGLHMAYDVIRGGTDAANTIIGAGANGFIKPLVFRGCSKPQRKTAEWFGADPDPKAKSPAGRIIVLSFGGAQRVQNITGDAT